MAYWRPGWQDWPSDLLDFWTERHLLSLTTLRRDGSPHVAPVGVALDLERECAWVITSRGSQRVANLGGVGGSGRVAACQVEGRRWSTLEGTATVHDDAESVARACDRYATRYRQPRENPERVALRIEVDRVLHSATL